MKAQILRKLLANALDARQQLATLVAIHQRDQAITHFQTDHVYRRHIVPAKLLGLGRALGRQHLLLLLHFLLGLLDRLLLPMPDPVGASGGSRETQKGEMRHARHRPIAIMIAADTASALGKRTSAAAPAAPCPRN